MSEHRSATSLEMEIHSLLEQFQTADFVADALIKKYENQILNSGEFEALATFLLHCGFYATLADFIVRKLDDGSQIPWGHFAESLFLSAQGLEPELKKALIDGASEQKKLSQLSRTHNLDDFDPEMRNHRFSRRKKFLEKAEKKKNQLLHEIEVLKSQLLFKEEDLLIQKLARFFPKDPIVQKLQANLRERLAQEYISKRPERPRREIFFPLFEAKSAEEESLLSEIEKSMKEALQSAQEHGAEINQALAQDFALAHLVWDNPEGALRLLEQAPSTPDRDWLKAEALLRARKFIELLEELLFLEAKYSSDAETVFAAHYLRAQALWGLEQKQLAIEILEGMVETRPAYRAATSLLREWKEDFV